MGTLFVFSRRASRYLLVPSFLSFILTFLYVFTDKSFLHYLSMLQRHTKRHLQTSRSEDAPHICQISVSGSIAPHHSALYCRS